MISFDSDIKWKEFYLINNRTKIQKHIRCFPDHLHGIHRNKGFCGSSVKVLCENFESNISDYIVVGCFERNGSLYPPKILVDNIYDAKIFKYDEKSECPFYVGKYLEEESLKNNKIVYIINSNLISWRYCETINKSTRIKFSVYLMKREKDNENKCKIVNKISSPLFVLKSSRYFNKNEPISPLILNEKEEEIEREEEKEVEEEIQIKEIEKVFEIDDNNNCNVIENDDNNDNKEKMYIIVNLNEKFPFEVYSDSPNDLNSYHIKDPTALPRPVYMIKKKRRKEEENNNNNNNKLLHHKNIPPPSLSYMTFNFEEQLPPENDLSIPPLIMNITEPLSPDVENSKVYSPQPAQLKSAYEVKIKKPTGIHDLCRMVKSLDISDSKREKKGKRREEFDFMGRNVYEVVKDDSKFYRQIDSKGNVTLHVPMFSISNPF